MFQNLEVFKMAFSMARHAGQRQAVVARNVANADTPGYRAKDLASFKSTYTDGASQSGLKATRPGHIGAGQTAGGMSRNRAFEIKEDRSAPIGPNGNSVSLQNEILRGVEAKRAHDRALAIYKSSMNILRTSLGRQ